VSKASGGSFSGKPVQPEAWGGQRPVPARASSVTTWSHHRAVLGHCRAHARGELRVVRVRSADLIGPEVRDSMAGAPLFEPLVRGDASIVIFADPDLPHSLSFADDVGEAMVDAGLAADSDGKVYHAPTAPALTPRELVALICRTRRRPMPRIIAPPRWSLPAVLPLLGFFVPPLRGISESSWMFYEPFRVDAARYIARFGRSATPLDRAVRATLDAYRAADEIALPSEAVAR
jgi:nucleoside-diphosphate-sugar epimerase